MILSASLASDRMPNILQWIQTIGRGQWDGHSLSSEWSSTTELHRIAIFRPRILQRGDMKLIKLCSTWRVIALLLLGSALLGATPPSVIAQGATTASSASKAQAIGPVWREWQAITWTRWWLTILPWHLWRPASSTRRTTSR